MVENAMSNMQEKYLPLGGDTVSLNISLSSLLQRIFWIIVEFLNSSKFPPKIQEMYLGKMDAR